MSGDGTPASTDGDPNNKGSGKPPFRKKKAKGNNGGARPPYKPQDSGQPGTSSLNPLSKPFGSGGGGPPSNDKFKGTCNHCGKYGHRARDCRKKQAEVNAKKDIQGVTLRLGFDATPQYDDESEKDSA
ncbi:zinc finger domain-containing protein [Candidatus Bathyarchaeota archaeon]|nr:zinc finger domain-containing protein [Candidatus Bathyarchaeota archaeon]